MNQGTPHIVLAGGGTAGHVNPLLAVAGAIRDIEPTAQVTVIGTAVGLEKDLVPEAGYELDTIEKVPFPRRPNLYMLRFPAKWKRETAKVRSILETRHADVVAGFGGYASAPVYATAHKMGIPIAIHEQNARAGMANKLGARWADFIGTVYEGTGLKPRAGADVERVGLPLRPAIASLTKRIGDDRAAVRRESAAGAGHWRIAGSAKPEPRHRLLRRRPVGPRTNHPLDRARQNQRSTRTGHGLGRRGRAYRHRPRIGRTR